MRYSTADLVDAHEDKIQVCDVPLRSYGGHQFFHGSIRTVRCYEDNVIIKKVLSEPGEDHVLVVDGGGSVRIALMGDVIAGLARDNGWAGVIIWGAVRDVKALATMDLGIKAAGSNPRKSRKTGTGWADVPVGFGGVVFVPGDWVYSDEDGIVVGAERFDQTASA